MLSVTSNFSHEGYDYPQNLSESVGFFLSIRLTYNSRIANDAPLALRGPLQRRLTIWGQCSSAATYGEWGACPHDDNIINLFSDLLIIIHLLIYCSLIVQRPRPHCFRKSPTPLLCYLPSRSSSCSYSPSIRKTTTQNLQSCYCSRCLSI